MRTLVVSRVPGELRAALLIDDVATDLCIQRDDEPSLVGAVFRGRILRVVPALPGAFVEIGEARPGFLPARKSQSLVEGAVIAVTVIKDAFAEKGAELRLCDRAPESGTGRLDKPATPLTQLLRRLAGQFDTIVTDDRTIIGETRRFLGAEAPDIAFEASPQFDDLTGLQAAFDEAMASVLALPSGGRIAFDRGAGFTQIDVDLGGAADTSRHAGDAIRAVNLAAAAAIARQLRLRNIGGAIVIDFISMNRPGDRAAVEAAVRAAVETDVVPVELHGWTRLGHLELTRQRTSRALADYLLSTTTRKTPATVGWEALRRLKRAPFQAGGWRLQVHPTVAAEFSGRLKAPLDAVAAALAQPITLVSDPAIDQELFDIGPARSHL